MRQGQPQNRQRSRGRGNNNRNNNNRNQMNRSMESNGPDVRIRGTAAHIAEKYTQLATDAQTSGDTVAAQSYWQFAEHYNRVIAAAQAAQQQAREEQEAKREARQEQNKDSGDGRQEKRERKPRRNRKRDDDETTADNSQNAEQSVSKAKGKEDEQPALKGDGPQPVIEDVPAEVALTETVAGEKEAAPKPRRARRPRKKAEPETETVAGDEAPNLPAFVTGSE